MQLLRKVHPSLLGETIIQIKSELDSQYHSLVTESQFDELGHIYYNLDERYNSLDISIIGKPKWNPATRTEIVHYDRHNLYIYK